MLKVIKTEMSLLEKQDADNSQLRNSNPVALYKSRISLHRVLRNLFSIDYALQIHFPPPQHRPQPRTTQIPFINHYWSIPRDNSPIIRNASTEPVPVSRPSKSRILTPLLLMEARFWEYASKRSQTPNSSDHTTCF
jgi:hypothetical protein